MFPVLALLPLALFASNNASELNNAATAYLQKAEYGRAEELFKAAIRAFEVESGESPDLGAAMSNLGELYRAIGRLKEAESWLQRGIEVRERTLGPRHPSRQTPSTPWRAFDSISVTRMGPNS